MKHQKIKNVYKTKSVCGIRADYIVDTLMRCKTKHEITTILSNYLEIKKGVFAKIGGFFCYSSAEQRFKQRFKYLSESLFLSKPTNNTQKKQKQRIEKQLKLLIQNHFDVKSLLSKLLQNHQLCDIKKYIDMNKDFFLYKNNKLNPYCFGNNPHWYKTIQQWFESNPPLLNKKG